MDKLPCDDCNGLCCGPVPITSEEYKKIKKKVRSIPNKYRMQLESQNRFYGTCIFYDLDQNKCGIYSARPQICQSFGYHQNLVCFKNRSLASKGNFRASERQIGTLTIDFTWKDFN